MRRRSGETLERSAHLPAVRPFIFSLHDGLPGAFLPQSCCFVTQTLEQSGNAKLATESCSEQEGAVLDID